MLLPFMVGRQLMIARPIWVAGYRRLRRPRCAGLCYCEFSRKSIDCVFASVFFVSFSRIFMDEIFLVISQNFVFASVFSRVAFCVLMSIFVYSGVRGLISRGSRVDFEAESCTINRSAPWGRRKTKGKEP